MPEIKPDIYCTDKLGEMVTFYTDLDSISVVIQDNTIFDFIVLLNNLDSAYTRIMYKESFLVTLKKAGDYSYTQTRDIPAFTYLDSEDENLVRIRKELRLDSVAGTGNEISRMLNVMKWVHDQVRHDGNSFNPEIKNAIDLLRICKTEKRGVNCRMMATILNECYLSLGIRSRMVTCMPKELDFRDCHVINAAFSTELNKWVWLDPSFYAYVMNEKGELLGIQEVRNRLVNDEPLILNPEANWNRKSSKTKKEYLYNYMAKNLYRLECPADATFNTETSKENKSTDYIQLLPLDGLNQEPKVIKKEYEHLNMTLTTYIINNPEQFWESFSD